MLPEFFHPYGLTAEPLGDAVVCAPAPLQLAVGDPHHQTSLARPWLDQGMKCKKPAGEPSGLFLLSTPLAALRQPGHTTSVAE